MHLNLMRPIVQINRATRNLLVRTLKIAPRRKFHLLESAS